MMFIIFASIFLSVFALLNFYITKRFVNKLDISTKSKRYFKYFLLINFFGIVGYMVARYNPEIPSWLYLLLSLPIGVLFLLFCTALIYDLSRVALFRVPISTKRRDFFKKTLDISSLAIAFGLSSRAMYEASNIEVEEIEIKLDGLNRPYRLVQLSDIHIGGLIDQVAVSKMVKMVNELKPDLVVITGDMVDIALKYARPALLEFKKLSSTYGTFFIVGNHEYFHGVDEIIAEVKSLGIRVLENENVYIGKENQGFNLAGVYDVMGRRSDHHKPDLQKALDGKKNSPTVLLAHQPRFVYEVSGVDLMLSGHTHGGQIYPFRFLVKIVQPYISGLHTHDEKLQVYVNKGTGFWGPPMRLGASSEITLIKLS